MPKLSDSAVPTYRKHKASGQAVVTLNGRDHYLGPHGTKVSHREYDRLVGEWMASGRNTSRGTSDGLTIAEAIVAYLRHAKRYYRKNGELTDEYGCIKQAVRFVKLLYCETPAAEFSALRLEAVRNAMIEANLARRTINHAVGRIRRMFNWLVKQQLVPASTWHELGVVEGLRRGRSAAKETEGTKPVADEVVDATVPHLPQVVADMVRFQRLVGCRPEEVCELRPRDLDQSNEIWRYLPGTHKMEHRDRDRIIVIGPQAQRLLQPYLRREPGAYCFCPKDSEADRRALAHAARRTPIEYGNRPGTNRRRRPKRSAGSKYSTDSYRKAVQRACGKAFAPPADVAADADQLSAWRKKHRWSPNQLRHTAATEIRRQFGLEAAQVVLGHSKADVTQIYAEKNYALAARVAEELG